MLTSAYHLFQTMFLFQGEGLNPIAYPANFINRDLYLSFSRGVKYVFSGSLRED